MTVLKENVKITSKIENYTPKELSVAVMTHVIVGIFSALSCRGVIMDRLIPFGISFLAGSNAYFMPASMIGAFASYFLPAAGNSGFRYIAALFAVLSIKLLLGNYKKIVGNPLFCGLISALACTLTGFTAVSSGDTTPIIVITEGLLSGGGAYFICKTFKALDKDIIGFSTDELTSILISSTIVLMGLYRFSVGGISLGRILALLLILVAAKYGGVLSGSISGISVGFTWLLSGQDGAVGLTFAIAGLLCGVFVGLGKYAEMVAICVLGVIGGAFSGETVTLYSTLTESVLASVLFFVLPQNLSVSLGKILVVSPKLSDSRGIKKSLTMRLSMSSDALRDVTETVEQVSSQLAKINAPDFGRVISSIEQEACSGCKLRVHCWESKNRQTVDAVMEMTKAIKQGNSDIGDFAPDEFKGRCLRPEKVAMATFKKYSDYASRIAAENRIDEVRGVVSDQLGGIADMLRDLSLDFENDQFFDAVTAENMVSALKDLDIVADEAGCRIDKYGRMTLEFKLKRQSDLVINKLKVMKTANLVCGRDFDVPNISEVGGEVYITLSERANLTAEFGAEQISAGNSQMCGDNYKYFNDGKGHFLMVLSDGMGTGGRAAVDGAMACGLMTRLLKAGFGYDCSLKFLNSSMVFKSTDESLATLDVASIDLFTGQVQLFKAGAAPTVIRRSGKTGKAESTSLPAGILRDVGFDKAIVNCRAGDIVVLMSDGATSDGLDWIRDEIEAWTDGTAQDLAERLCEGAKRRRTDNHEDDITVLTAILKKAV